MMQNPLSTSLSRRMSAQKHQARGLRVSTIARLLLLAVLLSMSFLLLVSFLTRRAWADISSFRQGPWKVTAAAPLLTASP